MRRHAGAAGQESAGEWPLTEVDLEALWSDGVDGLHLIDHIL
eukprot:COSAG04_NODE_21820_length_367_cov_0.507463_1_plen_41_part_10